MPIYELGQAGIQALPKTSFAAQNITEREGIQKHLREQIGVIAPDCMVIAEEFGDWDSSRRRIDLLCLDKAASLVVVELKRTEDGGHMELQAVRYSAMVSTMTFSQVVEAHRRYLASNKVEEDAEQRILEFLDWSEADDDAFAQDVRIVLAAAEFSKELTSAVLWLNEKGLDIRCVKMEPYADGRRVLLDIQQVIPLPETEQFQVQVRHKKQREQQARSQDGRDRSTFSGSVNGQSFNSLNKRKLMHFLVSAVIQSGRGAPEDLCKLIHWRENNLFARYEGELSEAEFRAKVMELDQGGQVARINRYFHKDQELFRVGGATYALTNQWGVQTLEAASIIAEAFPDLLIDFSVD